MRELLHAAARVAVTSTSGLRHVDLPDRLGDRRPGLRRPGRPHRPGQDHGPDHPALLRCSPASAPSPSGFWDFAFYRFLTGLGVGGEFAVGVSLVAEVMPDRARPSALGLLQALSAVGNIAAALFGIGLAFLGDAEVIDGSSLAVHVRRRHRAGPAGPGHHAPAARSPSAGQAPGRARRPCGERLRAVRRRAVRRPALAAERHRRPDARFVRASSACGRSASSASTSIREIIRPGLAASGLSAGDVIFWEDIWASITSLVLNVGAFFGIYAFSR